MNKQVRQKIIKDIIVEHKINNQSALMAKLKEQQIDVTQATISRDMIELNIVKRSDENGNVYYQVLPTIVLGLGKGSDEERLMTYLSDSLLSVSQVEFVNLLTVLPGNGQVIGVLLDKMKPKFPAILGCISGSDTVLILSKDRDGATRVNSYLYPYVKEMVSS